MKKILFVIPLISKKNCKNWNETCFYLNCTLASIRSQESSNHHTMIVCNETPDIDKNHPNLSIQNTNIILDESLGIISGSIDKQKKVYKGLADARGWKPDYAMIVDSDDLLHKKLVTYINNNQKYDGFILKKGYRYHVGSSKMVKLLWFHLVCGSSIVFPYNVDDFVNSDEDSFMNFYMTKIDHNKAIEEDFSRQNIKYKKVNFFSAIYIRGHGGSIRDEKDRQIDHPVKRKKKDRLRKIIGRLHGRKEIDEKIIDNFIGLENIINRLTDINTDKKTTEKASNYVRIKKKLL